MRALLLMLVSVCITLASGLTYEVSMYESADVNNHGGIITSDKTDIDFIIVNENYIQFKGYDNEGNHVGYSYTIKEPVIITTNGFTYYKYLVVKDSILYCLIFQVNKQLTVVNTEADKIEVFILDSYDGF